MNFIYSHVTPKSSFSKSDAEQGSQALLMERPKIALRKQFTTQFCFHLLGHVSSVLISAALIQLSLRNVYRSDDDPWDYRWYTFNLGQREEANLLQLAAKFHEILMTASLYGIVLHISRRLLVSPSGLPFGLLLGGYQPPSTYLMHNSLWAPLFRSFGSKQWRITTFAISLLFVTIFSNTLGPASAVALIPNIGWHAINNPFRDNKLQTTIFHGLTENMTPGETMAFYYPVALNRSVFKDETDFNECRTRATERGGIDPCPGASEDLIHSWCENMYSENQNSKLLLDFDNQKSRPSAFLATELHRWTNGNAVAVASTLHLTTAALVGDFWNFVSTTDARSLVPERQRLRVSRASAVLAPVVRVQCTAHDFESARDQNQTLFFPTSWLYELDSQDAPDQRWPIPDRIWNTTHVKNTALFTWVAAPRDDRRLHERVSIAAVLSMPWVSDPQDDETPKTQHGAIMPCVISAHWGKPEVTIDPTMNMRVESNYAESEVLRRLGRPLSASTVRELQLGSVVAIDHEWASLGFFKNSSITPNETTPTDTMTILPSPGSNFLGAYLGIFVRQFGVRGPRHALTRNLDKSTEGSIFTPLQVMGDPVSMVMSLVLADSMARTRVEYSQRAVFIGDADPTNRTAVTISNNQGFNDLTGLVDRFSITAEEIGGALPVVFEAERFGWGYGFSVAGSGTLTYAFVVLLLHAACVVTYLIYLFWFWASGGYLSSAWDDLGELLALAMASREIPVLGDVGAGVERSATWDMRVMVRSRLYEYDKLDLVVDSDTGAQNDKGLLLVGKKYR